uniref:Uncharacterized protein n=1 Tax=Octopus bimaculoides TaxID=37653 RepID=A0A0L8G965_OCTBM
MQHISLPRTNYPACCYKLCVYYSLLRTRRATNARYLTQMQDNVTELAIS